MRVNVSRSMYTIASKCERRNIPLNTLRPTPSCRHSPHHQGQRPTPHHPLSTTWSRLPLNGAILLRIPPHCYPTAKSHLVKAGIPARAQSGLDGGEASGTLNVERDTSTKRGEKRKKRFDSQRKRNSGV